MFARRRLDLADAVVVVTGAGSGIGRAMAELLAERGAHLAISDIDGDAVAETADRIRGRDRTVMTASFDVADRAAVEAHAAEVLDEFGRVDVVVNNAGVSLTAHVATMTYDDFEWLMGINFWGVVHGTKAFLPHLLERRSGTIVNVSSILGLFGMSTNAAYSASKFAVRGFTESLQRELAGTGVNAIRVHPGGVKTNLLRNGRILEVGGGGDPAEMVERFDHQAPTTSAKAAETIVRGIERRRSRILVGPDAVAFDLLVRLLPVRYEKIFQQVDRRAGRKR